MNKEELFVITDEGRARLELPNPSGITLKWVSNLFNDISKLTCSHSYTFNIPMTANNRRVLNAADDIRTSVEFVRKAVKAEFYINGVCLCNNASLYVDEVGSTYKCILTWKVLKAFQKMKSDSLSISELPTDGLIEWTNVIGFEYGRPTLSLSNLDKALYPVYDAGVPYTADCPPKPVVPIMHIIKKINDYYGTKICIGREMESGVGIMPLENFNNKKFHGREVYDDYVTHGVIPLSNTELSGNRYRIDSVKYDGSLEIRSGYKLKKDEWISHYDWYPIPWTWDEFNNYVYEDNTYALFRCVPSLTIKSNDYISIIWINAILEREYLEEPQYYLGQPYNANYNEIIRYYGFGLGTGSFKLLEIRSVVTIKGKAEIKVLKSAINAGRIALTDRFWIYVVKAELPYKQEGDDAKNSEAKFDIISDKTDEWIGLESVTRRETDDSYIYSFDFGVDEPLRKLTLDPVEVKNGRGGYFFWCGSREMPSKLKDEQELPKNDGTYVDEGDISIVSFDIMSIEPNIETFSNFPVELDSTKGLPDIKCFEFMKAVFFMNGAMPRVEQDGETISAMYYNQIRDRVSNGVCKDWSKYIVGNVETNSQSIKYRNTNFGQKNYFKMATSIEGMTQEEIEEQEENFGEGYGTIEINDSILSEEKNIYQSPFNPPFTKDYLSPNTKVGRTLKVWRYDKAINTKRIKPIYGVLNYRSLDSTFEDVSNISKRPTFNIHGSDFKQIHMNTFDPFSDMASVFGYLQEILKSYIVIKEKLVLDEFVLRDFDESMPVYLDKYNAYFAVLSIQRDKDGICTCEFIKLPHVSVTYPEPLPVCESESESVYGEPVLHDFGDFLIIQGWFTIAYVTMSNGDVLVLDDSQWGEEVVNINTPKYPKIGSLMIEKVEEVNTDLWMMGYLMKERPEMWTYTETIDGITRTYNCKRHYKTYMSGVLINDFWCGEEYLEKEILTSLEVLDPTLVRIEVDLFTKDGIAIGSKVYEHYAFGQVTE